MFEINVVDSFSSAHFLSGYMGKCENLHGHNWKVKVTVKGTKLNSVGILMDFKDLKSILNKIIQKLDHKNLNDLDYFRQLNPSSENIAKFIYQELRQKLIDFKEVQVSSVQVWEQEKSSAIYYE